MGIKRHLTPDPRPLNRQYGQQYIAGQSCSASFVAINGQVFWIGASEQWIGREWGAPQEFQYAGSLAPLDLTAAEQAALQQLAERLTATAGLQGLFGCDFIRNEQGLWLVEVNPRYTASMELLEIVTPRCLIAEHCGEVPTRFEYQEPFDPPQPGEPSLYEANRIEAKLIVYADRPGTCTRRLHAALSNLRHDDLLYADVPRIGTSFEAGNPICTLLNLGPDDESREVVVRRLLKAAPVVCAALDP